MRMRIFVSSDRKLFFLVEKGNFFSLQFACCPISPTIIPYFPFSQYDKLRKGDIHFSLYPLPACFFLNQKSTGCFYYKTMLNYNYGTNLDMVTSDNNTFNDLSFGLNLPLTQTKKIHLT